jgi:hypothetical protein
MKVDVVLAKFVSISCCLRLLRHALKRKSAHDQSNPLIGDENAFAHTVTMNLR